MNKDKQRSGSNESCRCADRPACSGSALDVQQLISRYDEYLGRVLGLAKDTRRHYLAVGTRFLTWQFLGGTTGLSLLNGSSVSTFIRLDAAQRKNAGHRGRLTAIRSLLRFLFFEGLIAAGMEGAIPRWRQYKHASLPAHLTDDQ